MCLSGLACVLVLASTAEIARAESLNDALSTLVKSHKRMLAANADLRAAEEQLEVTWGEWYPNLSITTNIAHEKQQKPSGSDDTSSACDKCSSVLVGHPKFSRCLFKPELSIERNIYPWKE